MSSIDDRSSQVQLGRIAPRKFRVFVVDDRGRPRARVAVALVEAAGQRVLAVLQSDHAGYAAFVDPSLSKQDFAPAYEVRLLANPSVHATFGDGELTVLHVPRDLPTEGPSWLPSIQGADALDRDLSARSFDGSGRERRIVGYRGPAVAAPRRWTARHIGLGPRNVLIVRPLPGRARTSAVSPCVSAPTGESTRPTTWATT